MEDRNKKLSKQIIILLWAMTFILMGSLLHYYMSSILFVDGNIVKSSKGIFDFSHVDLNKEKLIKLNGEVEFYADTLLYFDNFKDNAYLEPTGFIKMSPGRKRVHSPRNLVNKNNGFGTYRLKLLLKDNGWYGIKILNFKSAYNLSINGIDLGGAGKVSALKELTVPSRKQKEFFFDIEDKTAEIIIQVSNFHVQQGNTTGSVIFGSMSKVIKYKNIMYGIEILIFGVILILFLYHLTLFSYRRYDKSILYFSLLCMAMLLRIGYTGERIFLNVLDSVPWPIATKIEFISLINIPIFSILFLRELFPGEIKKWLVHFIVYFCLALMLSVIVLPSKVYSYIPLLYYSTIGSALALALFRIFVAILRRKEYSVVIFFSFLTYFVFSVHDTLYYESAIDSIYLMPIGLFFVSFSQAYVLAKKTSLAFSKVEDLSSKLKKHADELEIAVDERTKQIQNQKEEIETQKSYIEEWAQELAKTNEKLVSLAKFKRNMTNMMIHDLKAPLNNIIGFSELKGNFEQFREYVLSSGWEMKNLIQNILDVEKYEEVGVQLNKTEISLSDIAEKAFDNIYFMVTSNELNFENQVPKKLRIVADSHILLRVFANIFTNAVKYCKPDDVIRVTAKELTVDDNKFYKVNIYNSGVPIPQKQLDEIFNLYSQLEDNRFSHSYSSGIGLAFCKLAIRSHGGEIGVFSGEERGVDFWFTLPAKL